MPLGSQNFKTADDFKDPNKFYRVFYGDPAYEDILDSGKIRTIGSSTYLGTNPQFADSPNLAEAIKVRPTSWPSFSKGKANLLYSGESPNHYIIETEEELITPKSGRHGKGSTYFPKDDNGLDVNETKTKIYKHVGEGKYKKVPATNRGLGATAAEDLGAATAAGFAFAPMVETMIDLAMDGSKNPAELMKELEENEDPMVKEFLEDYRKRMNYAPR